LLAGFENIKITGITDNAPMVNRAVLNVNGPISSIPSRWKTKPTPQIAAVVNNIKMPKIYREVMEEALFMSEMQSFKSQKGHFSLTMLIA
jgi:hypothetical protein